jgi:hypothetical protein
VDKVLTQMRHMVEGLNRAGFVAAVGLEKSLRIREERGR